MSTYIYGYRLVLLFANSKIFVSLYNCLHYNISIIYPNDVASRTNKQKKYFLYHKSHIVIEYVGRCTEYKKRKNERTEVTKNERNTTKHSIFSIILLMRNKRLLSSDSNINRTIREANLSEIDGLDSYDAVITSTLFIFLSFPRIKVKMIFHINLF